MAKAPNVDDILVLIEHFTPAEIAKRLLLPLPLVYRVLRLHRPDRPRTPRRRTSLVRPKALALHAEGYSVAAIAGLLKVDEVLVYRYLKETKQESPT